LREVKFNSDKCNNISIFFLSYIVCSKSHRDLLKISYKKIINSNKPINKIDDLLISKSNSSISYNNKLDSYKSLAHHNGLIHKNNYTNESIWIPLAETEEDFEEYNRKKVLNLHVKKLTTSNNSSNNESTTYEIKNYQKKSKEKESKHKGKVFYKKNSINGQNDINYLTEDKINSDVFDIINRTVFIFFLLFILNLNLLLLVIFPYFIKSTPTLVDNIN
jgi:hypothetical protein